MNADNAYHRLLIGDANRVSSLIRKFPVRWLVKRRIGELEQWWLMAGEAILPRAEAAQIVRGRRRESHGGSAS